MGAKRQTKLDLTSWDVAAFVLGVLLLLGLLLYGLGKSRGMGRLARRLLLGGLIAGTALFFLFALAVGALVLFAAS